VTVTVEITVTNYYVFQWYLKGYFTHFKQISKLSNIDKLIFIKHNPKFSQSSHVVFLLFTLTIWRLSTSDVTISTDWLCC